MMMPSGPRPDDGHDKEFMNTLAKGLAVLSAFGKQRPAMTLSDAAAVASLSRATARRVLRTLAQLGYVVQNGRAFSLTPRVLELGFAYLSGQDWIDRALPMMKEVSEQPGASCQPPWRLAAGCRPFTHRSAAPSSAVLMARKSGAAYGRRPSMPIRLIRSPTCKRCSIAFAPTGSRDFPLWTKSLSEGSARLPSRFSTAPARRSAPSISRRTARGQRATRCARNSFPSSRPSRNGFRKHLGRYRTRAIRFAIARLSGHHEDLNIPVRFPYRSSHIEHNRCRRSGDRKFYGRSRWQKRRRWRGEVRPAQHQPRRQWRKPTAAATA